MAIRRIVIFAAFACCFLLLLTLLIRGTTDGRIAHDYWVYWRTANADPALAYDRINLKPFPYAPTMMLWIAPLGLVSAWVGYIVVTTANIASFYFALRSRLSGTAMALAFLSAPMVRCIRNGQVSAILTAIIIWACSTSNRIIAGIGLGVVASIKPQLVVMAPLMLALNRDWRAFFSAAATFAATIALSLLLFGVGRWPEWIESMDYFHHVLFNNNVAHIGVTPAIAAEYLGLPPLPFLLLGIAAGAWLIYTCRDTKGLEQATAVGVGSLLAAPYALTYDLVIVVPLAVLLVMRGKVIGLIPLTAMLNPLPLLISAWCLIGTQGKTTSRYPFRLWWRAPEL